MATISAVGAMPVDLLWQMPPGVPNNKQKQGVKNDPSIFTLGPSKHPQQWSDISIEIVKHAYLQYRLKIFFL